MLPAWLRTWLADFATAATLLTRLPMPSGGGTPDLAESLRAAPLVGAGIGLSVAAVFALVQHWGGSPLLAATLAVLSGTVLTGALHEDGLADVADAFGAARDRERTLEILRDSRLGTYGVLALIASFALRVVSLGSVAEPSVATAVLVAAHAASRSGFALSVARIPPARPDGLAAMMRRPREPVVWTALALGAGGLWIGLGLGGGLLAAAAFGLAGWWLMALARRRIGGHTGDVLGAQQQIGEVMVLVLAAMSL